MRGAAGNGDQVLDVGETWHYTCSDNPASAVVDTAIVSAVPINPVTGSPFAGRNPPVTASDSASVLLVNPAIQLTKSASPDTVVIAPGGSAPVTYTFTATNPGDTPLNRPGAPPAGTGPSATDPGWVVDPQCDQPTTFTGGDVNANQLLDPGEAWTFTCTNQVSDNAAHLVPNEGAITGQPSGADGQPLDRPGARRRGRCRPGPHSWDRGRQDRPARPGLHPTRRRSPVPTSLRRVRPSTPTTCPTPGPCPSP